MSGTSPLICSYLHLLLCRDIIYILSHMTASSCVYTYYIQVNRMEIGTGEVFCEVVWESTFVVKIVVDPVHG